MEDKMPKSGIEGVYCLEDFEQELDDMWTGKTPNARIWEHRTEEFKRLDIFKQREELRKAYDILLPNIIKRKGAYVNPYILDWSSYLNDNEEYVFMACRSLGCPFFPQYPVGKYCLDFGNPYFKVGLEVDSKTYHIKEKDIERDIDLYNMGWKKIYHLSSSEAYVKSRQNSIDYDKCSVDYGYDEWREEREKYYSESLWGIMECIDHVDFGGHMPLEFRDIAHKVAFKHLYLYEDGTPI